MLFTIGMSVFRQSRTHLKQALDSALSQEYSPVEILIRLDGPNALSTEDRRWLKDYTQSKDTVRIIRGTKNLGTFGSYRSIFNQAKGSIFIQLDADDRLCPSSLSRIAEVASRSEGFSYIYTQSYIIDNNGERTGIDSRAKVPWSPINELISFIPFHLRALNAYQYKRVGGYSARFRYAGDYDLTLRLSEVRPPILIQEKLYEYRVHDKSESQRSSLATHKEFVSAARSAIARRKSKELDVLLHSPITLTTKLTNARRRVFMVTGMHRSGTSVLSKLLDKLGIMFGDTLIPASTDNPSGYYEDQNLINLHRAWFRSALENDGEGWRDWGFSGRRRISALGLSTWRRSATQFASSKFAATTEEQVIGIKDPRLAILLPFWQAVFSNCRLIATFRFPWDNCDALGRIEHSLFREKPELALKSWLFYNLRLIEFIEANPEVSVLIHSETNAKNPSHLPQLLKDRFCVNPNTITNSDLENLVISDRLISSPDSKQIAALYSVIYPDIYEILGRLCHWADIKPDHSILHADDVLSRIPLMHPEGRVVPKLSVVVTTYNPCHFLVEALASILANACDELPVEVIIVDDGTTRIESLRLLSSLEQAGFKVVYQDNSGLSSARNRGISMSRADVVLPLDDDNRLLAPYLNNGLRTMLKDRSIDMLYGNRIHFGAENSKVIVGQIDAGSLLHNNRIDACALFRKDLWSRVGGYDESLAAFEDWDFWIMGAKKGMKVAYLDQFCFQYRVREGSMLRKVLANPSECEYLFSLLREKHLTDSEMG